LELEWLLEEYFSFVNVAQGKGGRERRERGEREKYKEIDRLLYSSWSWNEFWRCSVHL